MSRAVVVVVVVAVLALACGAASQSPAPAAAAGPASDCGSSITALAGCLTYITPGSPEARPAKDCCAGVKSALGSPAAVACLCGALGQDFGIKINYTRAAALPAACGGDSSALSKEISRCLSYWSTRTIFFRFWVRINTGHRHAIFTEVGGGPISGLGDAHCSHGCCTSAFLLLPLKIFTTYDLVSETL
uniref:Bifunctional inhibitor/plant lipid transfer protein/seed storage helical domain-containing protein n=1 Tax=Oryza nivara TaxID=4536 RepID=A0A0E0I4B5_ORYNI